MFVLGAGASRPAGLPLGPELLGELKSYAEFRAAQMTGEDYSNLVRHWERLAQHGIVDEQSDIEIVLTRIDLEIRRRSRARDAGRPSPLIAIEESEDPVHLPTFRQRISNLLSEYFIDRHHTRLNQRDSSSLDYLRCFLKRHVSKGDVIVTFNYDCLIEKGLHEVGLLSLRNGYGIDLSPAYSALETEAFSQCLVLKLHGSVGWYSQVVTGRLLVIDFRVLSFLDGDAVSSTYRGGTMGVMQPLVVPSYLKEFSAHPLPVLWRRAARAIRIASRIVVVGYSMPEADAAARLLLLENVHRRAEVRYFWPGHRSEVKHVRDLADCFEAAGVRFVDRCATIERLAESDSLDLQ